MFLPFNDRQHDTRGVLGFVNQNHIVGQIDFAKLEHFQVEVMHRRGFAVFHIGEDVLDQSDHFISA